MTVPGDAAVQEQAEPVVGEVAEPEADCLDPLDQQVDRLGGSVGGASGGEVGEQLRFPCGDGAAEPLELGYAVSGAGPVEAFEPAAGAVEVGGAVDVAQLLTGDLGGGDVPVKVTGVEAGEHPPVRALGQVRGPA